MTLYEAILILLASGLLFFALQSSEPRLVRNVLLTLSIGPVLFLAVEGATEILTSDEAYMIFEITDFGKLSSRQWDLGNFHTSIAITGNIVNGLKALLSLSDFQAQVLAKAIHWFLGFACLVGIFWTICRRWIPKALFANYFLIYFYSALLLPTNILSLKVANYDMLSMLLGVWGLVCGFIGWANVKHENLARPEETVDRCKRGSSLFFQILWPDGGFTIFGVVLTTLAAQEKQIAAPFLTLAIILFVLTRLRKRARIDWWMPVQIGICILTVLLVLLFTHGAVAVWRPPNLPSFAVSTACRSLFSHFNIVLQAVGIPQSNVLTQGGLMLITIALAATLLWQLRVAKDGIGRVIRFGFPLSLIVAVAIGIVGFYKVQAYVDPIYPISDGDFVPQEGMNNETVHFLSHTRLQHIIKKTGFAYAILATSIPTALFLLAVILFGTFIWKRQQPVNSSLLGFQAIGVVSSVIPLVHVLTNTPVGVRYFDIWLFTMVVLLGILGCRFLGLVEHPRIRALATAGFCLLLLLEILPFRPVIGAFWPWWARASKLQMAAMPEPGKLMPVWSGWGEEAMIAGRQLRKMALSGRLPSKSFRLFNIYPGYWLPPDQTVETYWIGSTPYANLGFTESDYYVVNRAAVMQARFRFPKNVKPVWTFECRGVPLAWVFRGSDLVPAH